MATEDGGTAHQPRSQGLQIKNKRRSMATYLMAAAGNARTPALDRIFAFLLEMLCYSQN